MIEVVEEAREEAPCELLQVAPQAGDEGVEGGAPLLALLHLHLHLLHLTGLEHLPIATVKVYLAEVLEKGAEGSYSIHLKRPRWRVGGGYNCSLSTHVCKILLNVSN